MQLIAQSLLTCSATHVHKDVKCFSGLTVCHAKFGKGGIKKGVLH